MLLWVNIFLLVIEFLLLKKINKLFTPLGLFVLIWLIALLFLPFAEEYYSYKVSDRFYLFYLALTSVNIFLLVFSGNNNKNVERKQYDRKYLSKLGRANDLVLILLDVQHFGMLQIWGIKVGGFPTVTKHSELRK